ncbi:MAG: hypothetical protein ACK4HV_06980 [Parachlamydiaceae bacterium]
MQVQYQVGPNCWVKDTTNGVLQVVAAVPFRCEGNLFYRLQVNGAFVLLQPNMEYLVCEVKKFKLYQEENLLIAKIKFNEGRIEVLKVDPATRLII